MEENGSESTNPARKTYACHICDRTFIRHHRLQSHIRTHRNVKNASTSTSLSSKANNESLSSPNSKIIKLSPARLIGNAIAQTNNLQAKKISLLSSPSSPAKSFKSFQKSSNPIQQPKHRPSILSYPAKRNSVSGQNPFSTSPATDVTKAISTSNAQKKLDTEDLHNITTPARISTDPATNLAGEIVIKNEYIDDDEDNYVYEKKSTSMPGVPYRCDVCRKPFKNISHLKRHKLIHTNTRPHVCKLCSRGFTQIGNLNVHYRTHTAPKKVKSQPEVFQRPPSPPPGPMPVFKKTCLITRISSIHTCEDCGKKFNNKCYLDRHALTHSKEKPHVCQVCFKGFAQVGNLNVHYLTHTNVKPFACHVCDKAFTLMGSLKAHLHTHSEMKPFQCEVCGKGFSNKCFLKRHFLTHTEVKPYVCNVCQKGFVQVGNLNVHLLTHTKEKDFKCEVCSKGFSRKLYLQKHYKQHIVKNPVRSENNSGNSENDSGNSWNMGSEVRFLLDDKNCRQECVSAFTENVKESF